MVSEGDSFSSDTMVRENMVPSREYGPEAEYGAIREQEASLPVSEVCAHPSGA